MFKVYGQMWFVVLPIPKVPVSSTQRRLQESALMRYTFVRPDSQFPNSLVFQSGNGMSGGEGGVVSLRGM